MILPVDRPCAQYRCTSYHVFDHRFSRPLGRPVVRGHDRQLLQDRQHLQGYRNRYPCARFPLVHSCEFSPLPTFIAHKLSYQCWIAVRKENKILMVAFFLDTTLFIASICSMFGSDAFRLIFMSWPFFRSLTAASLFGLVVSLGLSVLCRMRFGRGLAPQRTWSFI